MGSGFDMEKKLDDARDHGGAGVEWSEAWFTPWRFGFLLGVAIAGAFPGVLAGLSTFFFRDFGVLGYPMVYYHRECFWRGEFPLWNPLSNCGAPFLAQWGTMALYPGSLFYLVLPLPWSLNFFCLAHLFLAGLGMYFLAWRWVGNRFAASVAGMGFVFNGVTLSCLMWPNYTVALGWMPWVILVTEQAWREGGRKVVGAGILATMQMLSGVPEVVLLTWLVLAALWLGSLRRPVPSLGQRVFRTLAVILLVCGLSAAQLLPFFELLAHSQRTGEFATAKWAMPASGWVQLVVPLFRCFLTPQGVFFQTGQEFLSSTYLGVGAILLGMFAVCAVREPRIGLLAALGLFALLMALGDNGFLYGWLKRTVPLLGFARYPIKFVILAAFVCSLLAAYAVRLLQTTPPGQSKTRWRTLLFLSGGLLFLIAFALGFTRLYPTEYDHWPAILRCGIWRTVFLIATVGLVAGLVLLDRTRVRRAAATGLLALLVLDAATHVPNQNPTLPAYALAPGLWELHHKSAPPKHGQGRVMISPNAENHLLLSRVSNLQSDLVGKRLAVWSNLNLLEGIPKVNGSSTLQIREQMEVQALLYSSTNAGFPNLEDFLSVAYATTPGQIVEWAARTTAQPLVTGGQRPIFAGAPETLRGLTNASFNPREVVYLPLESRPLVAATNRSEVKITPRSCTSQRIDLEITARQASLLVIGQSYHSPWRAYVDEKPTTVWRANHAFQAVEVPEGSHQVRLAYEDRRFFIGGAISVGTLLLCAIGFWGAHAPSRVPTGASPVGTGA